ncbi:MAG TPA: VOC family protein [Acidimicrobiales bacterium]|nr:VOC family protein [Acidimicrobiales bacterium]
MPTSPAVLNHFGHCVTDLDRSSRFYCSLFGFVETRRIEVPDDPTSQLLSVEKPVGLRAAYLEKDGATLELLAFDRAGNPAARRRPFNEPGLTHMSFCVDDLAAACSAAVDLGGSVIEGTDIGGMAVMIRDPDGQPIELLPMAYRASIEGGRTGAGS